MYIDEGYKQKVSMLIRININDWESKVLNHPLTIRQGGSMINHYYLVKIMLVTLMEDILRNSSVACDIVLVMKGKAV